MLVSYAQNREDLFLWALVGHRAAGRYVDIGCNDERQHSVTRMFYEHGWSGINVDANRMFAAGYQVRDRDRFIEAGVGAEPGFMTFREYAQHNGLSTFHEGIKSAHEASGLPYVDRSVEIRTVTQLIDEVGMDHVDFLKVDVEGLEPEVLTGLDLSRYRPTVVVVEAMRAPECDAILLPADYRNEFFDGLNVYYVDNQAADVNIYNYAERILKVGFRTDREQDLIAGRPVDETSTDGRIIDAARHVERLARSAKVRSTKIRNRFRFGP